MEDFLSFNRFITQDVLIVFYYLGALLMPILLYLFRGYLLEHVSFFKTVSDRLRTFYGKFGLKEKILFWLVFLTLFLCMELCWRMIFEAMIGYFDMHDYLYQIMRQTR